MISLELIVIADVTDDLDCMTCNLIQLRKYM
jgi:hypothetical protein